MTVETLSLSTARPRNRSLGRGLLIALALVWLTLIVLAPLGVRLAPLSLRHAVMARYFGIR